MDEINNLIDGSNDRKYFIQVPQIVMAICRNPYDYTLWSVIKMIAGELGECVLATKELASLGMMSTGKASDSRTYLLEVGLLEGRLYRDPGYPQPIWHLKVPDMWKENIEWRQAFNLLKDRVELKDRLKSLLDEADVYRRFNPDVFRSMNTLSHVHIKSFHNMKANEGELSLCESSFQEEPSQYEGELSYCEGGLSQNETKKNHVEPQKKNYKEKPEKELSHNEGSTPSPPAPIPEKPPITKDHPAIQTFRAAAKRFPGKATWELIAATVGDNPVDLSFFKDVVVDWNACGWNPMNIKGMLDYFTRRELPTTRPSKNGGKQNVSNKSQRSKLTFDPRTGDLIPVH